VPTIEQLFPDVQILLALAPEELAPYLLLVAKSQLTNGMFGISVRQHVPYRVCENEAGLALAEGWNWLEVQGLIVPAPGINGKNGWSVISRRGSAISDLEDFRRFREAVAFPKSLLHPAIADKVWLDLVRGDLADAVFTAFRAVEEAVRKAGGYGDAEIGVDLMRKAFDPKGGPLADMTQEKGEREALSHMFAGAIGSYKNPHSHRTVSITDKRGAGDGHACVASLTDRRGPSCPKDGNFLRASRGIALVRDERVWETTCMATITQPISTRRFTRQAPLPQSSPVRKMTRAEAGAIKLQLRATPVVERAPSGIAAPTKAQLMRRR
jgi:uncharacterized protein (TIGR02391 family)